MTISWIKKAIRTFLDYLIPPLCIGCQCVVEGAGGVCASCWPRLNFLGPPWCHTCGTPFELSPDPHDMVCPSCLSISSPIDKIRAALAYDGDIRPMILGYKHGDRTDMAPTLAAWMKRVGSDMIETADYVVPVPLHRWRLWRRRYNQAALLAQCLAPRGKFVPTLLVRNRATKSQGLFSSRGRHRNVAGAFRLKAPHKYNVQGKTILLVDDVFTTGATVRECARELKKEGASRVDVLTLARVVRYQ